MAYIPFSPSGQHYLLLSLSTGFVLTSLPCAHLSEAALGADIRLLSFSPSEWNHKVLRRHTFALLFSTSPSKAICLSSLSQVNMVIQVKSKVEQTPKTLMRFSCWEDKGTEYFVRLSGRNGYRTNRRRACFFRAKKDCIPLRATTHLWT